MVTAPPVKLPLECAGLDALLGGGLEPGTITLFYGEVEE